MIYPKYYIYIYVCVHTLYRSIHSAYLYTSRNWGENLQSARPLKKLRLKIKMRLILPEIAMKKNVKMMIDQWVTGSMKGKIYRKPWFYHHIYGFPVICDLKMPLNQSNGWKLGGIDGWTQTQNGDFSSESWKETCGFWWAKSDVSQQIMGASHSATDKKLKGEPQNKSVSVPKAMVSQAT